MATKKHKTLKDLSCEFCAFLWLIPIFALALLVPSAAFGQVDFAGNWAPLYHEDFPERIPGPELGDYPYSASTTVAEYYDRFSEPNGDEWFTVTTVVTDPEYLAVPFVTTTDFKKEPDGSRWNPIPCSAR